MDERSTLAAKDSPDKAMNYALGLDSLRVETTQALTDFQTRMAHQAHALLFQMARAQLICSAIHFAEFSAIATTHARHSFAVLNLKLILFSAHYAKKAQDWDREIQSMSHNMLLSFKSKLPACGSASHTLANETIAHFERMLTAEVAIAQTFYQEKSMAQREPSHIRLTAAQ